MEDKTERRQKGREVALVSKGSETQKYDGPSNTLQFLERNRGRIQNGRDK